MKFVFLSGLVLSLASAQPTTVTLTQYTSTDCTTGAQPAVTQTIDTCSAGQSTGTKLFCVNGKVASQDYSSTTCAAGTNQGVTVFEGCLSGVFAGGQGSLKYTCTGTSTAQPPTPLSGGTQMMFSDAACTKAMMTQYSVVNSTCMMSSNNMGSRSFCDSGTGLNYEYPTSTCSGNPTGAFSFMSGTCIMFQAGLYGKMSCSGGTAAPSATFDAQFKMFTDNACTKPMIVGYGKSGICSVNSGTNPMTYSKVMCANNVATIADYTDSGCTTMVAGSSFTLATTDCKMAPANNSMSQGGGPMGYFKGVVCGSSVSTGSSPANRVTISGLVMAFIGIISFIGY